MLLICNGAQKSGSTWLYNILTALVDCQEPDPKYLTGNSRNPCISPDKLGSFLDDVDIASNNYISKNHLARPEHRDLLLGHDNIYVFDIERDPKDVVVSSYYDARNRSGYKRSFLKYYWSEGRELVEELNAYHAQWRDAGTRCHVASYEELKNDFPSECRAIADILGISLNQEEIEQLRNNTSMDKLRKKYADQELYEGDKFFRKGLVGDWKNHFNDSALKDLESILETGIGSLDFHHLCYRFRRWLNWHLKN